MKKILIIAFFLVSFQSQACDICGCGASSYYMGIMPQFHRNFVGLRYRFQSYDSHINSNFFRSREKFINLETLIRVYIMERWQVTAFVPYQFNTQTTISQTKNLNGVGDISLFNNFKIVNYSDSLWKHQIWLGIGFKVPIGKYNFEEANQENVANPNFQLGTGSWDFIGQLNYTIRYKNFGLISDISCKINTKNQNQYQFGNRLNIQESIFWIKQFGKVGVMPNLGLFMEFSDSDYKNQLRVENTGGYAAFGTMGLDLYYKKLMLGFSLQNPISQKIANEKIIAHKRLIFQAAYLF